MWPIEVDGVWVCKDGKPWVAAPAAPGSRPGGLARTARTKEVSKLDLAEAARRTAASKIYWTAYRAGQEAKLKAVGPHTSPSWTRPKKPKSRQWIPGKHKK